MPSTKIDIESADWRGQWAMVTGATSGIGREFARQLASRGMYLVLTARRASVLESVAAELAARHCTKSLTVVADLSDPAAPALLRARTEEAGIRIRLLVNNAGFGRWGRFEAQAPDTYRDMLQVNVIAPVCLCAEMFLQLTSYPDAAIINVSSPAAYQPVPYMAVYAASKAFVQAFSQAIFGEWANRGVLVQTLVPGPTETDFDRVAGAYGSAIAKRDRATDLVAASLKGLATGRPTITYARGTVRQRLFALMPARLVIRTVGRMFDPPQP